MLFLVREFKPCYINHIEVIDKFGNTWRINYVLEEVIESLTVLKESCLKPRMLLFWWQIQNKLFISELVFGNTLFEDARQLLVDLRPLEI